jgi:Holliday junction resolvase RusA-like endonuclease
MALPSVADPIILLLPLPPSANRIWRNNRKSAEYRKWIEVAGWEAKTQLVGIAQIKGEFSVKLEIDPGRKDLDNSCIKTALDLCQAMGAIKNDKLCREIHVYAVERQGLLVELSAL